MTTLMSTIIMVMATIESAELVNLLVKMEIILMISVIIGAATLLTAITGCVMVCKIIVIILEKMEA